MKKAVGAALVVSLSWLLDTNGGYGAETKEFEAIMTEMTASMSKLANIFTTVKDQASADKVHPEVKKIAARMNDLTAKFGKLGKPTSEQLKELKKYEKPMEAATEKLTREALRLSETEYGKALVREL